MNPAPVRELDFERPRAGCVRCLVGDLRTHARRTACRDDLGIGNAGADGVRLEIVKLAELRVAEHQPVVGIPEHERFGDGLHGVSQAHVGRGAALDEAALVRDVDRDPDEVAAAVFRLDDHLGTGAQPEPPAIRHSHPEIVVDVIYGRRRQPFGQVQQVSILGMDHPVDLAEGQELVPALVSEKTVERARPVDAAARNIPIPQSAAASRERGVHPALHAGMRAAGRPHASRIGEAGPAEARHREDEHRRERGLGRPEETASADRVERAHERELPEGEVAHASERVRPVLEARPHGACPVRQDRDRLLVVEQVAKLGCAGGVRRMGGDDASRIVEEVEVAARERAGRKALGSRLEMVRCDRSASAQAGEILGDDDERQLGLRQRLRDHGLAVGPHGRERGRENCEKEGGHENRADDFQPNNRRSDPPERRRDNDPRSARAFMQSCRNACGVRTHASSPAHLAPFGKTCRISSNRQQ